jgi:hypothetical protein
MCLYQLLVGQLQLSLEEEVSCRGYRILYQYIGLRHSGTARGHLLSRMVLISPIVTAPNQFEKPVMVPSCCPADRNARTGPPAYTDILIDVRIND